MHVRVVPAGGHEARLQVDPLGPSVGLRQIGGPAERTDHAVDGHERFRAGAVADVDPAAVEKLRAHKRRMLAIALDRCPDEAAVFRPAPVVVPDLLVTEQVLEDEPGVRAALADPAVRDGLGRSVEALLAVDAPQLVGGLEPAVLADRGRPWHVDGALDVAATLGPFLRQVLWGE